MQVRAANCVLFLCLAAALAAPDGPRSKRHLQQWKDAILSKFFGNTESKEKNVRFFRIPGHDNILVKAVPKIDIIETAVVAPEKIEDASPTIAILKSYLGTKSTSETLSALQGVRHLLQSGMLSVRHEPSEVFPYEKSALLAPPFVSERIELVQHRPSAVMLGPPKTPLIPVLPPAASAPEVIEEIIPVKTIPTRVPELVPYPKLSYKLLKKDGSVVAYTINDEISSDVVVTESVRPLPRPPSFIDDRLRKIFLRLPLGTEVVPLHPLPLIPSPILVDPLSFDVYSPPEISPIHAMTNVPQGEVQVHTYPATKVNIPPLPLPPIPGPIQLNPLSFDVYSPPVISPIHTMINVPKGEVQVHTYPATKVNIPQNPLPPIPRPIQLNPLSFDVYSPPVISPIHAMTNVPKGEVQVHTYPARKVNIPLHPLPPVPRPIQSNPLPFDVYSPPVISPIHTMINEPKGEVQVNTYPAGKVDIPLHPLPAIPSPIQLNPSSFDVYRPPEISPMHKMINVSKDEVQVHSDPIREVNINDKLGRFTSSNEITDINETLITEKSALSMPSPPPFIVDRIKNAEEISAKVPKGTPSTLKIVNREEYIDEQEFLRNPDHIFYNSQPIATPLTSDDVHRQPSSNKSNPNGLYNYDSKGAVNVKVNRNHAMTTKPNEYYYQQIQDDFETKFLSDGRRGYAFKINHDPYVNSNNKKISTEQPITIIEESGITKSSITKNKENLGAVYFAEPVPSSYVYKQISHSNPQPFTVVQVEDKPTYKPVVPVAITHEHPHTDGSTHKCKENHQVEAQLSKDYFYVPPVIAEEMLLPNKHKVEKLGNAESQFFYVQLTNNAVLANKDDAFNDGKQSNVISSVDVKVKSGKTTPKNLEAFSDNPIVVPETTYSFTQTHSDGSEMNVRGDNGKGVTVELSENGKSRPRGDIPDAF